MRPSELVAKAVIEAVLEGTTMQFRPDQGDGSHDFDLRRGMVAFGAVEVTSAADQPRKSLIASMADGRKGGYNVPAAKCRSSWLVELMPDASVNGVRRDIDEYLAGVESAGLTSFTESDVSRRLRSRTHRPRASSGLGLGNGRRSARQSFESTLPRTAAGLILERLGLPLRLKP